MNQVVLIGRLTDDPAYNEKGEIKIAKYSLAVDRMKEGADFPSCVAFGRQAEFADKYLKNGMKIAVIGRIQTGSYTNREGSKVYTTDVIVDHQEFCEKKQEEPKMSEGRFTDPPKDFENPFE